MQIDEDGETPADIAALRQRADWCWMMAGVAPDRKKAIELTALAIDLENEIVELQDKVGRAY